MMSEENTALGGAFILVDYDKNVAACPSSGVLEQTEKVHAAILERTDASLERTEKVHAATLERTEKLYAVILERMDRLEAALQQSEERIEGMLKQDIEFRNVRARNTLIRRHIPFHFQADHHG